MTGLKRQRSRLGALVIAGVVLGLTVGGCTLLPHPTSGASGSGSASTHAIPTGTKGAVDFDKGFLTLGSGSTVVDTFIDPMCPYCGEFEKANGSQLGALVNDGTITLRIHPLTFLDQASGGSKYSSRASSALTCVAVEDPTKTLVYLSELYENQPQEGTSGLSDAELVKLAGAARATNSAACITAGTYIGWVQKFNDKALHGGITGADITSIKGTPTILVNGHVFNGDFTSADAVKSFIASGGASS
jgi:protein-disulfide isomerase